VGGTVVDAPPFALEPVLRYLPASVGQALRGLGPQTLSQLEEIRLRAERPLSVTGALGEPFLTPRGLPTLDPGAALHVRRADISQTLERMAGFSVYALEAQLRQGFLTLPGGHRVGLVGRALAEDGRVRTLKDVAGINVRLAHSVPTQARRLLPLLLDGQGSVHSTLLVSPPRAGKTTLLRELVRLVSTGVGEWGLPGQTVAVVDERSELAGCDQGVPTLDLGPRTDVMDACPKAEGLGMLVRAMGPRVVATDELGREEDARAVLEALACGVQVLATVHGASLSQVRQRPSLASLWAHQAFSRVVVLSRRRGPGTLEGVWDGQGHRLWPEEGGRERDGA
jgi:stage III sporulation protein AA